MTAIGLFSFSFHYFEKVFNLLHFISRRSWKRRHALIESNIVPNTGKIYAQCSPSILKNDASIIIQTWWSVKVIVWLWMAFPAGVILMLFLLLLLLLTPNALKLKQNVKKQRKPSSLSRAAYWVCAWRPSLGSDSRHNLRKNWSETDIYNDIIDDWSSTTCMLAVIFCVL